MIAKLIEIFATSPTSGHMASLTLRPNSASPNFVCSQIVRHNKEKRK
jgi:uncharacterized protein (DUF1499 family)